MSDFTNVATCVNHPEVAYVSYEDLHSGGQSFHGVAKTHDAGATWELVWKESDQPAANPTSTASDGFSPVLGRKGFVFSDWYPHGQNSDEYM
jgi:photosystem II stability/assembly factor-like uncharacterized protein